MYIVCVCIYSVYMNVFSSPGGENTNRGKKHPAKPNNKTLYDITCYLPNNRVFFTDYLFNDMNNLDTWKNPFVTTATGDVVLQSGWCKYATNGGQVGYVWGNGRDNMDHVTVCTCTKIPCNGSNVSENKIYLD